MYVHLLLWWYECAMCMFTSWFLKAHIESVFANALHLWADSRFCLFVLSHICAVHTQCLREGKEACMFQWDKHTCNVFDVSGIIWYSHAKGKVGCKKTETWSEMRLSSSSSRASFVSLWVLFVFTICCFVSSKIYDALEIVMI